MNIESKNMKQQYNNECPNFFKNRMISSNYIENSHYIDIRRTEFSKLKTLISNKFKLFHPATCNLRIEIVQLAFMIQQHIPRNQIEKIRQILKTLDQVDSARELSSFKKNTITRPSQQNTAVMTRRSLGSRGNMAPEIKNMTQTARLSTPPNAITSRSSNGTDLFKQWKSQTAIFQGYDDVLAGAPSEKIKECVINHVLCNGNTLLHEAIQMNKIEIVKEFLIHGSKFDLKNKQCMTPLLLAAKNDYREIVSMLIAVGATVTSEEFKQMKLSYRMDRAMLSVLSNCVDDLDDSRMFNISAPSIAAIAKFENQIKRPSERWNKAISNVITMVKKNNEAKECGTSTNINEFENEVNVALNDTISEMYTFRATQSSHHLDRNINKVQLQDNVNIDISVANMIGKYMYDKLKSRQTVEEVKNEIGLNRKKSMTRNRKQSFKDGSMNNITNNISNLAHKQYNEMNAKKTLQRRGLEQALASAQILSESDFADKTPWVNYFERYNTEKTQLMWENNQTIKGNLTFRRKKRAMLLNKQHQIRLQSDTVLAYNRDIGTAKVIKKKAMLKSHALMYVTNNFGKKSEVSKPRNYKKTVHGTWILNQDTDQNKVIDDTPKILIKPQNKFDQTMNNIDKETIAKMKKQHYIGGNTPFMFLELQNDIAIPNESRFHRFERNELKAVRTVVNAVTNLNSEATTEALRSMNLV